MNFPRFATFALLLGATTIAQAQMAVATPDLSAVTRVSWSKQVADMANQLRAAENQLRQAKATFDSLNGSRGIGNLLHNPTLYNYLPPDATTVLRAANTRGIPGADAIRASQRLLGISDTRINPNSATAAAFTSRQVGNANYQLLNEQGYQAAIDRIRQLDAMTKSIDGATDPMKIQALQVRVQTEQGLIANEQARLAILANMATHADRVRDQQSREIGMKSVRGPIPAGW